MKENYGNGSCKRLEFIDALLKMHKALDTNAPVNGCLSEYQEKREKLRTIGIDPRKYGDSIAPYLMDDIDSLLSTK